MARPGMSLPATKTRLLLNTAATETQQGRSKDGPKDQYVGRTCTISHMDIVLMRCSQYPIPPATPAHSTSPALLAVSPCIYLTFSHLIPPHATSAHPKLPQDNPPLTSPSPVTAHAPSATGPSTAPGSSTNPSSAKPAKWSSRSNTTACATPAKRCD